MIAAILCSLSHAQSDIWLDTLDASEITGSDTVVWKGNYSFPEFGGQWSVDIEYSGLDDDDATISIGGGNFADSTWNQMDDDDLPFTLDVTTNSAEVNGVSKTSVAFYGYYWPFRMVGVKVDPGSVTTGDIIIRWTQAY